MADVIWKPEERALLIELCESNKTLSRIKKALPEKTEAQIRTKCKNLGISFNKKRKAWSDEELAAFKKDWENHCVSNNRLRGKYQNRSITALRACARRLGLAERPYDDSYLRIGDIMAEMKVSKDRVRMWIKHGLKTHKSHIKPVKYLISAADLLKFLEEHPDYYDASEISAYLFYKEPEWLKKKRIADAASFKTKSKHARYYEDAECREIQKLFKLGKSNKEIADTLGRTEYGIERILNILNLSRKHYNQYELDIIYKHHETLTIDEIAAMLPLRTRAGIISKCEQLGIKYKTTRKPRSRSKVSSEISSAT